MCRHGEPGGFCHVKSGKGRERVERDLNCTWAYPKTQNRKRVKVASNWLQVSGYQGVNIIHTEHWMHSWLNNAKKNVDQALPTYTCSHLGDAWEQCYSITSVLQPSRLQGADRVSPPIDGFQMSINCPTSGGQMRDKQAAIQQSYHFERNSFFYLSVLIVRTRCSTSLPILYTQLHQTHTATFALWKWSHTPWKPSIPICVCCV